MPGKLYRSGSSELENVQKSADGGTNFRRSKGYSTNNPLVFISHRQSDVQTAIDIANFLINFTAVDIYLESFNPNLSSNSDPNKVVSVIDFGLNMCTHLLAVISDNTRGSWWVPYEVGVARNRPVPCGLVLLDEVKELPEYLKTTQIIKDSFEISNWVKKFSNYRSYKSVNVNDINIKGLPYIRTNEPRFIKE